MFVRVHGLLRQAMQCCLILTLFFGARTYALDDVISALNSDTYPTIGAQHPHWVQTVPPFSEKPIHKDSLISGVIYQLMDQQFNAQTTAQPEYFFAMEMGLKSARGVASESIIRIPYISDFQHLVVNQVLIKRGDTVIDKLTTATHQVLNLEPELDSLMITGQRELVLTLKDVQVGDTLYYAYTVSGANPVYNGLREHSIRTSHSVSIDQIHVRVLVDKDDRLSIRRRNIDDLPDFEQFDTHAEYRVQTTGTITPRSESDAPAWYDPRAVIVFSDIQTWNEVVNWVAPMYAAAVADNSAVLSIAKDIMNQHRTEKKRIGAALDWVQHKIRYFGIETGINSHKPRNANLVIDRGFGDCKDKTVLLVSLLEAMNIKASPALVNTRETTRNQNNPYRLHAFNHVITHLNIDGNDHWLDPTMTGQIGALGELYEPDYGRALILDEGQNALTNMANPNSGNNNRVAKLITAGAELDATATLKVMTYQTGLNAEYTRRRFEDDAPSIIQEDHKRYYRDYYNELRVASPLKLKQYSKNRVLVTENYNIGTLWQADSADEQPYQWFYADEINRALEQPKNPKYRSAPFDIPFPLDFTEAVTLNLDDIDKNYRYTDDYDTPWFILNINLQQEAGTNTLKATWHFQTKVRTIAAEDAAAYSNAIDDIHDWLNFYATSSGFYFDSEEEPKTDNDVSALGAALETLH